MNKFHHKTSTMAFSTTYLKQNIVNKLMNLIRMNGRSYPSVDLYQFSKKSSMINLFIAI